MTVEGYDDASKHRSIPSLEQGDTRVGWISVGDSRAISAACDRWLEKRGIRTRSAWWDSQLQNQRKK